MPDFPFYAKAITKTNENAIINFFSIKICTIDKIRTFAVEKKTKNEQTNLDCRR